MASTVRLLAYTAFVLALFSVFHLVFSPFLAATAAINAAAIAMIAAGAAAVVIAGGRIASISDRWSAATETWMNACSVQIESGIEALSSRGLRAAVIMTAGLSLFLELVLIRWEAGLFVVFALYKNFTLLSCFCGLGIGYAKARDRQLALPAVLPMLLLLLAVFSFLRFGTGHYGNNLFQVVPVREEVAVFFGFDPSVGFTTFFIRSLPIYGFSSLYLIALALYGLAWLTMQPGTLSWRQFEPNLPEPDPQEEVTAHASASHPRSRT